ncbi:MAG: protein-L-isoaspartate(D-aspartate) O-methyltransferase [Planctomycetia bacterium]|nr:protein-L-isoaspartate(D-aspartate) O-methyltransferase [Planctomycetia bacterium]
MTYDPPTSDTSGFFRFDELREVMVRQQFAGRGIVDARVLAAMREVPRHEFVPQHLAIYAYDDKPLPIGFGQTISQPYTVAFMCQAMSLHGGEKVLEIGTGSGYAAAVLSHLAERVYTIERIAELAAEAAERLRRLGYANVEVRTADGTLGLADAAPFDAIVVTAGAQTLPPAYQEQLAEGGRIVIPIGPTRHSQTMWRYTRVGDDLLGEDLGPFAFVPLIGEQGWNKDEAEREWC